MLLKLLHRLHQPGDSSWAAWARRHGYLASIAGDVDGNHWDTIEGHLPAYRCITRSMVGNGASTSFFYKGLHILIWQHITEMGQNIPQSMFRSARMVAQFSCGTKFKHSNLQYKGVQVCGADCRVLFSFVSRSLHSIPSNMRHMHSVLNID